MPTGINQSTRLTLIFSTYNTHHPTHNNLIRPLKPVKKKTKYSSLYPGLKMKMYITHAFNPFRYGIIGCIRIVYLRFILFFVTCNLLQGCKIVLLPAVIAFDRYFV